MPFNICRLPEGRLASKGDGMQHWNPRSTVVYLRPVFHFQVVVITILNTVHQVLVSRSSACPMSFIILTRGLTFFYFPPQRLSLCSYKLLVRPFLMIECLVHKWLTVARTAIQPLWSFLIGESLIFYHSIELKLKLC